MSALLLDRDLIGLGDAAAWQKIANFTSAASNIPIPDPTVKAVVNAVALVTGLIANSRTKVESLKAQTAVGIDANQGLRLQSIELDKAIVDAKKATDNVNIELKKAGLQGLDGLFDWVKETIAPNKTVGKQLVNAQSENARLVAEVENKIGVLDSMRKSLQNLQSKLTGGNTTKVLLIGGGIAVGLYGLYSIAKHFHWI